MDLTTLPDLNDALTGLLEKYAVNVDGPWRLGDGSPAALEIPAGTLALLPGWSCAEAALAEHVVPLLPWRSERRFQELRNLVRGQTVVPVLVCRFACVTDGATLSLDSLLYREFDLAEWLGGAPIASMYASIDGELAANAIVRLENDVVCSVEVATTLPAGTRMHDRHELIARRGVASDRVVDTQVPQSSVYVWSDIETAQFTDMDAELAGLDADSVALVRAACDALKRPESRQELRCEHQRLRRLVALACQSDRQRQRLETAGRLS
jgi:hypothetical protein